MSMYLSLTCVSRQIIYDVNYELMEKLREVEKNPPETQNVGGVFIEMVRCASKNSSL